MSRSATRPKAPWAIRSAVDISKILRGSDARLVLARDNSRKSGFRIVLEHRSEIDVFDALDVNALEFHRFGRKRLVGVDSHFRADAVIRRWIKFRALRARDDDEVAIGLKAGRNRPFDFAFIVDIDIHVDHDDLLDVVMAAERAHDDILRLTLARLLDLDGEVIAARSAAGEAYVAHRGEAALQMVQKRCLAGNAAKQKMLCSAADDGMENWILAMRDRIDLDHFTIGARPVILRKLAERPLGLANLGQNAALDDDFGVRRHAYPVGKAFRHFH